MSDILISTMNDVPGYEITEVHGEVFGLIVRARNAFSNIGAGFRTIVGGEAKGYTKLLTDSRMHAQERLVEAARERGANAVIAMRFDCNEIRSIASSTGTASASPRKASRGDTAIWFSSALVGRTSASPVPSREIRLTISSRSPATRSSDTGDWPMPSSSTIVACVASS